MNKFLYTLVALFLLQLPIQAQTVDQRTTTTKIADLLALQPAENAQKLSDAMKQIDGFTQQDIAALFNGLSTNHAPSDAKIEFAGNSYAFYVMQPGKDSERTKFVQGLLSSLETTQDQYNKSFIIALLQKAGKDDAVSALSAYLTHDYLSGYAARALASIGSSQASSALLKALPASKGGAQISIIEALGDAEYEGAEAALLPLFNGAEVNLQKVILYSLARIGRPSSYEAMKAAAQQANYAYSLNNATGSYLQYAERLNEKNEKALAEKIAGDLLKDASGEDQIHTRTSALKLLANIKGSDFTQQLIKYAGEKNTEFRNAALMLMPSALSAGDTKRLLKVMKKGDEQVQSDIIRYFGSAQNTASVNDLRKILKGKSQPARAAAITSLARIDGSESLPLLLKVLDNGTQADRDTVKSALMAIQAENLLPVLTEQLPSASPANQVIYLDVLANRAYAGSFQQVSALLKSDDPAVKEAAYRTLPRVARSSDLPALFSLIGDDAAVNPGVIKATVNGVEFSDNKEGDIDKVLSRFNEIDNQQKLKYLPILAQIGGKKSLNAVLESGKSSDSQLKNAAILALAKWNDQAALPYLTELSQSALPEAQFSEVIKGIIRITAAAEMPGEQKVLIYRNAMELAKTNDQKRSILRNLEATDTYNALIFAGKYLNEAELSGVAANTVMNIALNNKEFYGADVNRLLTQVVGLLTGSESSYLREAVNKHLKELPTGPGYVSLFNGSDLSGWKGLVQDPIKRSKMSQKELQAAQKIADEKMRGGWEVQNGVLTFTGKGDNIVTEKQYGDFEMLVDWKLDKDGEEGDAGVYLRGTPQVQIWDISRTDVGAEVGSGGLYNNQKNESKPLTVADNPLGEWNTFKIRMQGDRVTVHLNGVLVTDSVVLENYWDKNQPIFPIEQIELQAHGTKVYYRDIFVKELPRREVFQLSAQEKKEGFQVLFDGTNLDQWTGNKSSYFVSEEGTLAIKPSEGSGGNLFSREQYGDFIYRLEFRLTPGANNGIGIRAPLEGDAAYEGMEIQVLDDDADMYKDLEPFQYHGSVYGIMTAKRGHLKPMGEWNQQEIYIKGNDIKVTLNGTVILQGNLAQATKNGTLDKKKHPGLDRKTGHIGFLGHGSEVHFKNIRIKDLSK